MAVNDRTRVQLLGYLLGALKDAERDEVERQLERHPELCDELESLGTCLEQLAASYTEHEPPAGLATRTISIVEAQLAAPASSVFPSAMASEVRGRSRWSMADGVVLAGGCLAAAMLFFPAIPHSRYAARIAGCQNQLRELGISLIDYSEKAGEGYFSEVRIDGKQAFAGRYGPACGEAG